MPPQSVIGGHIVLHCLSVIQSVCQSDSVSLSVANSRPLYNFVIAFTDIHIIAHACPPIVEGVSHARTVTLPLPVGELSPFSVFKNNSLPLYNFVMLIIKHIYPPKA